MKISKVSTVFSVLLVGILLISIVGSVSATPKDSVRVWVTYQSGRKAEVAQQLAKANASVHYDFPELEAYVVTLPAAALNGFLNNPFVVDVEEDPARYPIEPVAVALEPGPADTVDANGQVIPWGIDAVQARDIWDADRDAVVDEGAPTGAGIKVCIIDTGFYTGHEDFAGVASAGTSQVDNEWFTDGYGHGTHVAGTITAVNNSLGVVGVNPGDVDLFIVKIFANDGSWVTGASDLVAGIYACRDNGADVISMSLGGTKSNRTEMKAFDSLYAGGILHIAAAGNEQVETPYATSYPAGYASVVSVAAVDSAYSIADFSLQNADVELAAPGVGVLSTLPYLETNDLTVGGVSYPAYHIENAAYGTASGTLVDGGLCTSTGSWSGNVVLCQRGTNTFAEKVMNVQNSGGVGAIIYNNVAGDFLATLGDVTSAIPAVSISLDLGAYLAANNIGDTAAITCALEKPGSGYEAWNGTSMATPHVSGVAALIWSANPTWSNVQIREAMTSTALDLGADGRDSVFGFGLVQAKAALDSLGGSQPPDETQLNVALSSPVSGSTYANGQSVIISGTVSAEGVPVEGATVKAVITFPNNKTATLTGTTTAEGTFSLKYKINTRKTGTGTFTLLVSAEKVGFIPGTASVTFLVK